MNYLLLIETGDGTKSFGSFQFLGDAERAMEQIKQNPEVEYLEIVHTQTVKAWSNPNCCPEA